MTSPRPRTLKDVDCGLSVETITKIHQVFAGVPVVGQSILYGSRAKGNYRTGSDIDLTFIADTGAVLNLDTIYQIDEKLDELLLPYSFDLSILADIDNQNLVEHIQRVGIIFYQKNHSEEVK